MLRRAGPQLPLRPRHPQHLPRGLVNRRALLEFARPLTNPTLVRMISAIVFPQFVETCRDHIREQTALNEDDFETFEQLCLDQVRAHNLSSSPHQKPSPARFAFRALPTKVRGGGNRTAWLWWSTRSCSSPRAASWTSAAATVSWSSRTAAANSSTFRSGWALPGRNATGESDQSRDFGYMTAFLTPQE